VSSSSLVLGEKEEGAPAVERLRALLFAVQSRSQAAMFRGIQILSFSREPASVWLTLTPMSIIARNWAFLLWASKQVAKIVHCGLPQDSFEALRLSAKLLRSQVLQEAEHFRRGLQQKVAKIVQCGETLPKKNRTSSVSTEH
jgi:hypothetical protein